MGVEAVPEERLAGEAAGAGSRAGDVSAETRPPDHTGTDSQLLTDLLRIALDEEAWEAFSRASAIRRAGRAEFARNVCIGVGSLGSEDALPVLRLARIDPEPAVRMHAASAVGRIPSSEAGEALSAQLEVEPDETLREELRLALERRSGRVK